MLMSVSFTDRQASRWREKPGVLRPLGNNSDSTRKDITGGLLSLFGECECEGACLLSCERLAEVYLFFSLKESV